MLRQRRSFSDFFFSLIRSFVFAKIITAPFSVLGSLVTGQADKASSKYASRFKDYPPDNPHW